MNILFCENLRQGNLPTQSVHVSEIVTNLRKLGHNVVLLSEGGPGRDAGSDVTRRPLLGQIRSSVLQSRIFKPIRGGGFLLYVILRDIWSLLQAFIIVVKQKRKFDIIYRRDHLLNSEYLLAKLLRVPLVKEVNGIVVDEVEMMERAGKVALPIIDRIERFNKPRADKFIVVTPNLKELLQKDYRVPGDKIEVIPNGANTDIFKPMDTIKSREKLNLNQNGNYVCFVGAFHEWQGIEYLVKSVPLVLPECPDTRFLLVGNGAMKEELIDLAARLGVSDRVIFTGRVPYQEVSLYVNASDLCVVPKAGLKSGYSPLKLCEYMACQKPVVASRASGLEIVEDSRGGILVEPGAPAALAEAIVKLLQNQELRKQMGEYGRKYVVENQSWESVANKVADVCQSLIDSRRHGGEP